MQINFLLSLRKTYPSQLKSFEPRILFEIGETRFEGYECIIYKVSMGGRISEVCYSPYSVLSFSELEAQILSAFLERFRSVMGVSLIQGLIPGALPVVIVNESLASSSVNFTKLEKLASSSLSKKLFSIPDNYESRN